MNRGIASLADSIQSSKSYEIEIFAYENKGKYGFEIRRKREHDHYAVLKHSNPNYTSEQSAVDAGQNLVATLRRIDLSEVIEDS